MAIAMKNNFVYSAEWKSLQIFEYGIINGPDINTILLVFDIFMPLQLTCLFVICRILQP